MTEQPNVKKCCNNPDVITTKTAPVEIRSKQGNDPQQIDMVFVHKCDKCETIVTARCRNCGVTATAKYCKFIELWNARAEAGHES